jgi:hypothetical protein
MAIEFLGFLETNMLTQGQVLAAEYRQSDLTDKVTSVSQMSDVRSSDWAFIALQSLVQRYPTLTRHINKTFQGNRSMTRYEFAVTLNTFLTSLQQQRKIQKIDREDLPIIKRLQAEFSDELATLNLSANSLETRVATLENSQFAPTTTLSGEVILAISDDFGGETEDNLALQQRTQLTLRTSFTGEDRLRVTMRNGNVKQFSYVENLTYEGRLGFDTDTEGRLELSNLSYQFPIDDRASLFIAPVGDDVDASNPILRDRGTGSISRFGRQNPIYRLVESGGVGLEYEFSDELELSLGYYNQEVYLMATTALRQS